MRHEKSKIYQSRWHLLATFSLIVIPFLFLLVFARLIQIATSELFTDVLISLWRLFIAYWIAVSLAWVWAILFYRGRRAAIALPIFDVLQSFPTFAALPLATLFLGSSNFTVIFFLVITVIWPIFFSIIGSLRLIKRDWEEVVTIAKLSRFDYLTKVLWPVSIPGLITGSIIGLGDGWGALVATEIIVKIKPGLGSFFQAFSHNVSITALGILGFLIIIFSIHKLIWLPLLEWSHRKMEE